MRPDAPSFVPASQKDISLTAHMQASTANAPGTSSHSRGPKALLEKTDAPSATASTPSVSCSNSVLEEDKTSSRSPRSEVTSAETIAVDAATQREHDEVEEERTSRSDSNEGPPWQEQEVDLLRAELEAERLLSAQLRAQLKVDELEVDQMPSQSSCTSSGGVAAALESPSLRGRSKEADVVRVTIRTVEQEVTPTRRTWAPSLRMPAESSSDTNLSQCLKFDSSDQSQRLLACADPCYTEDAAAALHFEEDYVIDPEAADLETIDSCGDHCRGDQAIVIDPEAADPSERMVADCAESSQQKSSESVRQFDGDQKLQGKREMSKRQKPSDDKFPGLDVVLGSWWDAQHSFYEVAFDVGSSSSCSVKTTRPDGRRVHTRDLIHQRPTKARRKLLAPVGTIIWSNNFALQTPLRSSNTLCWKSLSGGKSFVWTRDRQQDADDEEVSPSAVTKRNHRGLLAEGKWLKSKELRTSGRVWRAVEKKEAPIEDEESNRTDQNVAASRQRFWKIAKGGQWRMIEK